MEKYIGIIAAEDEEVNAILEFLNNIKQEKIYNLVFNFGTINNQKYVIVKSGIGKVNAARTTQILIDKFDIKYIINVGSAGGLDANLNIGDIVIGKKLVQHDFDVTSFGREKGYIPETGKEFESDKELINKCKDIKVENSKIILGNIASGDIFLTDVKMKNKIKNKFNCACVEMEGAAIAQVCFLSEIPFLVIRSISDIPNGNNQIEFNEFLKIASKNCSEIIKNMSI